MPQVADGRSPSQHRDEESKDDSDSDPDNRAKPPKPKVRKARTGHHRPESRPQRYNFVEDDAREPSELIRRPKSALYSRSRLVPQTAPQTSQQCQAQYYAPPHPRAYQQGFIPPKYDVSLSSYQFLPPQQAHQANQAQPFIHRSRYINRNAGSYGYPPPRQWNVFGQPVPPARPYPPQLPGFSTPPMRRGPPTLLGRENHELKTELELIKVV